MTILKQHLHAWCKLFVGGQASHYWTEWAKLTNDNHLLADIRGIKIDCNEIPVQHWLKHSQRDETKTELLANEILPLQSKQVIERTTTQLGHILSGIFLHPKNDGSYRLILNLKQFNNVVEYHHFKMDSLYTVINLMEQDSFMASIDIKDAYYSFAIYRADRKYLCFELNGELYRYTCLPNGLSSAPRKFTKLLKVPLSYLHEQGHISSGHLDDFYLQGKTYSQCVANVVNTVQLFAKLGLISHPDKCNFIPSQTLIILGFVLNSKLMTIKLTISHAAKSDLNWWVINITSAFNTVSHGPPVRQVTTDASLQGWGAEYNNISTGGLGQAGR